MAHIAIVTGLLTGRINASFEMASRLGNEGHTITYLCQPKSQKRIEENGFNCFPVSEITFDYKDPRRKAKASWVDKFKFHFAEIKSHYKEGKKILKLEEHKEVLRTVNPDLILIDTEIHDLIFTAVALKIPVKLITTWFSDTISLKSPSVRTGIIPGKGFSGTKLGVFLSWLKMRTKINARVILNKLRFENYRRWMFKKYAQEIGFDTRGMLVNTLPPLYSFTKLPVVSMSMSELEFPHKFAENIIYVGPMVYVDRKDKTVIEEDVQRLELIYREQREKNKRLIYCEVGSLAKGHLPFLKKVIEAVQDVNDYIMIMSIGPKMNKDSFEFVPDNVYLFNWVPQLQVIENSDLCISHCGINGINECVHFKTPMLLYSCKYTEGDGNSARFSYHGLGISGDIIHDSSEQIKQKIARVFEEPSFENSMDHFNALYLNYKTRRLTPLLFEDIE